MTEFARQADVGIARLTVGPDGDEGGGGEEEDVDHVAAEEEPAQRGQVVEPGGRVRVERLVEERLEVGLPAERPDGPQALEGDDEVGEDGTPGCGGKKGRKGGKERGGAQRCSRREEFICTSFATLKKQKKQQQQQRDGELVQARLQCFIFS